MTVQFELWHLITLTLTVLGLFVGLGKVLLAQFERRIDERFVAYNELHSQRMSHLEEQNKGVERLDRDFMKLRLDLAENYVRRDDYIRGQTVIEAKLDAISLELKNVQIQGAKRES